MAARRLILVMLAPAGRLQRRGRRWSRSSRDALPRATHRPSIDDPSAAPTHGELVGAALARRRRQAARRSRSRSATSSRSGSPRAARPGRDPGLGELADVDRDAPARFDLLPFEPGSYPVRLIDAERRRSADRGRRTPRARARAASAATRARATRPGSSTAASTAGRRARRAEPTKRRAGARAARRRAAETDRAAACPSGSGSRSAGAASPPPRPPCAGRDARAHLGPQPRDRQQRGVEAAGELRHPGEEIGVAGEVDARARRARS